MARSIQFNSIRKSLKTMGASFEAMDGANNTASARIKIDVDTAVIQGILKQVEKFPYEARKAFKSTLEIIANDLMATLDENMEAKAWDWKGDKRDIVETGDLKESGRVYLEGDDIVISYSQEYAAIVHFGGYIKSGFNPDIQIYYPARPWVEATLLGNGPVPGFDFNTALEENFLEFLGRSALKGLLD